MGYNGERFNSEQWTTQAHIVLGMQCTGYHFTHPSPIIRHSVIAVTLSHPQLDLLAFSDHSDPFSPQPHFQLLSDHSDPLSLQPYPHPFVLHTCGYAYAYRHAL